MKIVAENHAETCGALRLSADAFLAAVIAEHLRADLDHGDDLPDHFLVLARTLDRTDNERPGHA